MTVSAVHCLLGILKNKKKSCLHCGRKSSGFMKYIKEDLVHLANQSRRKLLPYVQSSPFLSAAYVWLFCCRLFGATIKVNFVRTSVTTCKIKNQCMRVYTHYIVVHECLLSMREPHVCFSMAEKVSLIHAFKSASH